MKVYTKTTNDKYELPIAVADSKRELAMMLGQSIGGVTSAFSHKISVYHEIDIGEDWFPDNDGGLWRYGKKGEVIRCE